jgi:uncharacterized protein (TIGR00730 family)
MAASTPEPGPPPAPPLKSICVFCGSSPGRDPAYLDAARSIGRFIATRSITLVYGGGKIGLMGAVADAALAAGGHVIGVLPKGLARKELAHDNLPDMRVVGSMHERKALMASLADGFIALPGGFGTLDEFCEILTWSQLGLHAKPCAVLNVNGFFDLLLGFLDGAVARGFIRADDRSTILVDSDPAALLDRMAIFRPEPTTRWLTWNES